MKKFFLAVIAVIIFAGIWIYMNHDSLEPYSTDFVIETSKEAKSLKKVNRPESGPNSIPNEWMWKIAAWPDGQLEMDAVREARAQAKHLHTASHDVTRNTWLQAGPVNIGGRITDIALDNVNEDRAFIATAAGGVFRTEDGGDSWDALFQNDGVLAIGDIVIDQTNTDVLYLGTGEANASSYSFPGDGIWKSVDGGDTWEHLGLENSHYIGRIVIDPNDSQTIFTAALGKLFGTGPDRGVYRSTDGGLNWDNVLFISDSTSCSDLYIDPANSNRIFACMWERTRSLTARRSGGQSSGVWRSVDGGDNWSRLSTGLPIGDSVGRPGIALSAANPSTVYVSYAGDPAYFLGLWRSTNSGDTWVQCNDQDLGNVYSSFGWYFGNLRVDPHDEDIVHVLGVSLWNTLNGGDTWNPVTGGMHVDFHALEVHPLTRRHWFGCDGGLYVMEDGSTPVHIENLPISQFYKVKIDPSNPGLLYGGTQDNGSLRSAAGGVDDWYEILGGDGFWVEIRPDNSQTVFAEYQWGNIFKSIDGGFSFSSCDNGIVNGDRRNWSTPYLIDPTNHDIMYYGTYRLYRSTDSASSWSAISEDLTGGISGGSGFSTLTSIAVSAIDNNIIWTGSDDGIVTRRSGSELPFEVVSQDLPLRWITDICADPNNPQGAIVSLGGLRWNDSQPHIYRTWNLGEDWVSVSGNLPDAPVYSVIIDPQSDLVIWAATETGCYWTYDGGEQWSLLGAGLPFGPVLDLDFEPASRLIAAATHGRSIFTIQAPVVPVLIPDLSILLIANGIQLSWNTVENANHYRVYKSGISYFDADSLTLVTETESTNITLDWEPGSDQMYYRVRAISNNLDTFPEAIVNEYEGSLK
jgi:photosystem II stability/assembly factor-like uncharacterized protein